MGSNASKSNKPTTDEFESSFDFKSNKPSFNNIATISCQSIPDDLKTIIIESEDDTPPIPEENSIRSARLVLSPNTLPPLFSPTATQSHSFLAPLQLSLVPISASHSADTPNNGSNKSNNSASNLYPPLIRNGITGKFISSRICKIAADFWKQNLVGIARKDQLEIGCSIFCSMLSANKEMKKLMNAHFCDTKQIENTSLKYLDMMGWLVRGLVRDNIDLYALLTKLGTFHQKMGIKIEHFNPMLQAMHETFCYYFPTKYSIEVKYSIDEIFLIATQIMSGQDLKRSSHLNAIAQSFQSDNVSFLESLDCCLKSSIGFEYLARYLQQTWCDEIAIFLQSVSRFKNQTGNKGRFMVARDIMKTSIHPTSTFCINISYESRGKVMEKMQELEGQFVGHQELDISRDFFSEVEKEIYKLIIDNHWTKFVQSIKKLQIDSHTE